MLFEVDINNRSEYFPGFALRVAVTSTRGTRASSDGLPTVFLEAASCLETADREAIAVLGTLELAGVTIRAVETTTRTREDYDALIDPVRPNRIAETTSDSEPVRTRSR